MFQVGNQYGKMSKRGKALDKEMRERIKELANCLIDDINIEELTKSQKVNLLKTVLPYLIPKETSVRSEEQREEVSLTPPTVIVFGDTKEYQAYNSMTEVEKNNIGF